ncbi:Protein of unknown function DUF2235 [Thiorhodococcus drewsii AZ1]|uniref:T6SS Phospholipase effector Tle1-like catalytic domain-containing protein n=1 Tax=Thiorhodococcus drewsii AZ1 TaxID=765913 RepID=G2E7I5_9GAMM|nr:DUF2235 domain-containing protein [Thiorhodococcus drewsii]EGV27918.1 Protein of unknown function DUF2235 [Thiorhodococcus drewsii AZ1]
MTIRRLVVCFDGTWNTPDRGGNPTNVVKMVRAVRPMDDEGVSQIAFYDKGVGTGNLLDRVVGGASGVGLTENIIDGYRFLANNYVEGDEIYVFGFSRGAYTARSLVGFIALVGMLSPNDLGGSLREVIEIYRDGVHDEAYRRERIEALGLERKTGIPIRCVGVWDTVGALGIPGDLGRRLLKSMFYFQNVQLDDKVTLALHAIGIDEKRSAFAPTLWVGPQDAELPSGQTVEQVWFPGVHSNVGGSYKDAGLSDVALDWMVKRISALTDLALDQRYLKDAVSPNPFGKGVESRTAMYKSSLIYPYQRIIDQVIPEGGRFGNWFRATFPAFARRNVPPSGFQTINERLHVSTLERWTKPVVTDCPKGRACAPTDYRPPNLEAVIRARRAGKPISVVGWDGEVMEANAVPWPQL